MLFTFVFLRRGIEDHKESEEGRVETLEAQDAEPVGLAQLHPDVFAVAPR